MSIEAVTKNMTSNKLQWQKGLPVVDHDQSIENSWLIP